MCVYVCVCVCVLIVAVCMCVCVCVGHSLLLMNQSKLRSIGVTNKDHR